MKGGYQIIDLKDINFTIGTGSKVDGVYKKIEGSYRKPCLLSNITIGGAEKNDRFVNFDAYSGTFYGVFGVDNEGTIIRISVDNKDTVTIIK